MNIYDIGSSKELIKIINIIQKEFCQLSPMVLIKQLKSIPKYEDKPLRLFATQVFRLYEKAKDSSIDEITKYFHRKRSRTSLHHHWLNLIDKSNTTHSIGSKNIQLKLKSGESMNTTVKHSKSDKDKSFISNMSNLTPKNKLLSKSNISAVSQSKMILNVNTLRNNDRLLLKPKSSSLAQSVIVFIDEMNQLQQSIITKSNNVSLLKKSFEKKKALLYKEALKNCSCIINNNNNLLIVKESIKDNNAKSVVKSNKDVIDCKSLKESIAILQQSIEDLKLNNKYITDQLRNEIKQLSQENNNAKEEINTLIKTINKQKASLIEVYSTLFNNKQNPSETTKKDFAWYANAILKEMNSRHNYNNNEADALKKIHNKIKATTQEMILIINPYLEHESEIDFNSFNFRINFEEEIILSSIESLKMYIKSIIATLINYKKDKETLSQLLSECETKAETYKSVLDQTVIRMTKNENEKCIYNDNITNFDVELLNIQSDLLKKIELNDIEAEAKQEEIRELLQLKRNGNYKNKKDEKYNYMLGLYCKEQEKVKRLKSEYLHLIQDFGNYIENGNTILVDIHKLTDLFQANNSMSQIHIRDQYSMKGEVIKDIRIDNEMSGLNKNKNIEANALIKRLENKVQELSKVIEVIGNKLEEIVMEMASTHKSKEMFMILFKLIDYSEEKIEYLFSKKEGRKIITNV